MQVNGTISAALSLTDHVNISVRFCVYNVYKNKKVYPEITSVHDILPSKWHHVLTDVSFHKIHRTTNLGVH